MDYRWPNLIDLAAIPGLDPVSRRRLIAACASIYARTDFRVMYNTAIQRLHFYIREPDMGAPVPTGAVMVFNPDGSPRTHRFNAVWIDEMCRMLRQGRAPRHLKDRAAVEHEVSQRSDAAFEKSKAWSDRERDANNTVRRVKNRQGMGSKFRPSVLVNGLKGSTV